MAVRLQLPAVWKRERERVAVRLQLPAVWEREREWQSDCSSPPSGRERESGSQTAAPRHLEEGERVAVRLQLPAVWKRERESGSQTAAPRRLDCRGSSITLLCDQNYTVSGQRAKEEGGGEISPPPLPSSAESETVRRGDISLQEEHSSIECHLSSGHQATRA